MGEGRVVPHVSKYQDGQPGVAIANLPAPEVVAAAYQQAMRMWVESQYEIGSCYCLGIDALFVDTMGVLPGIRELDLSSPYVDDDLLGCLVQFPNLEVLQLRGSWITDEGLRHLAHCPNLLSLSLQDTQITDAALMRLAQTCPKLEVLRLSGTQVTHRGLADLTGLANLRYLFIPLGALRGEELRQLEKLSQLDHLRVAHPGVWDTHSRVSAPLNREDVMSLQALLKYLRRPNSRPWPETFQLLRRDQYYSEDALPHGLCRWLTFTPEAFELLTKEQQQTVVESSGREPLW